MGPPLDVGISDGLVDLELLSAGDDDESLGFIRVPANQPVAVFFGDSRGQASVGVSDGNVLPLPA
jgi:hypothetical protein